MDAIQTSKIHCPYCGERIEIIVDCSIEQQDYIEDCSVCCRPISISVYIDGTPSISVKSENE